MKRKTYFYEVENEVEKLKDENQDEDTKVREGLQESVSRLKPPRPKKIKCPEAVQTPQVPTRKSHRLGEVTIDFSEKAIAARAIAKAKSEKKIMDSLLESKMKRNIKSVAGIIKSSDSLNNEIKNTKDGDQDEKTENEVEKLKNGNQDEDTKTVELSEYEKMIQKNKQEQISFLEFLRMSEVKEGLQESVSRLKPPRQKKIKNPEAVQTPQVPTRKSHRLGEVTIDFSEKAIAARAIAKAESEKKIMITKLEPVLSFEKAITGEDVYGDFVSDFEDMDFKSSEPLNDYVSHFQNMKIDKTRVAKVVRGSITAAAFHPMQEEIIVSVGSKNGAVGLWHVNSGSVPYEFKPHLQRVTNMKFNPYLPNMLYTSSYDGTMRCGDIENKNFIEIYNISDESSCTYFDFISSNTFLVSQTDGNVSVVDNRSDQKTWEKRHRCHEYSVKSISIHPVDKNYFVSADVKGVISLWDQRKLRRKPLIKVHHHEKAIYSAFFSPVTGNSVLTTSAGNFISLFDTSKLGRSMKLQKSLNCRNWTPRSVSARKAIWLPNTDDIFCVGSMNSSGKIEIFDNEMKNIFNFQDEYLDSIIHATTFHPSMPVLAGCNSNGKVYVCAE